MKKTIFNTLVLFTFLVLGCQNYDQIVPQTSSIIHESLVIDDSQSGDMGPCREERLFYTVTVHQNGSRTYSDCFTGMVDCGFPDDRHPTSSEISGKTTVDCDLYF